MAVLRRFSPQLSPRSSSLQLSSCYLTFRFDTESLLRSDSAFALILGWAPQYLRLATTIAVLTIVLAGNDLLRGLRSVTVPDTHRWRIAPLAVHATFLLAFTVLSASLFESDTAAPPQLPLRTVAWFIAGAGTLVAWGLAVLPISRWRAAARAAGVKLAWAAIAGGVIWSAGFITEQLWRSLARYTFAVVEWTLRLIYPSTVSDTVRLVVGTPTFKVAISPECSGYEGIGLIVGFLSVYLWLCRRELRFPAALVLLPIGAVTIWIVNAMRIVALIAIGTSGSPAIALGGFHSQAGWIAFNVIALGFVGVTMRGGFFQKTRKERRNVAPPDTVTAAYIGPFAAITATAMLTGAVSAGFDWWYPLRLLVVAGVLWAFRKQYTEMKWSWSWISIAIGAATFVMWLALLPSDPSAKDLWPATLSTVPFSWAAAWLAHTWHRLRRGDSDGRRARVPRVPGAAAVERRLPIDSGRTFFVGAVSGVVGVVWRHARPTVDCRHARRDGVFAGALSPRRDWRRGAGARDDEWSLDALHADDWTLVSVVVTNGSVLTNQGGAMRARWIEKATYGLGLLTLVLSLGTRLFALAPVQAPEIDASSMSAGLGLLAAGVMIVRSRMRSK